MPNLTKPASPQYQASDPLGSASNLYAFYPMHEGAGSTLHDVANHHDLVFGSAPTWGTHAPYGATVSGGGTATASGLSGTPILPLSFALVGTDINASAQAVLLLSGANSESLDLTAFLSGNYTHAGFGSTHAPFSAGDGGWHTFVATYTATTLTFYYDGTALGTAAYTDGSVGVLNSIALNLTGGSAAALAIWASTLTSPQVADFTANPFRVVTNANQVTLVGTDPLNISLSATAWPGVSGSVTQQWYRSTAGGFTPPGAGTAIAGATGLTLTDTAGLVANTPYFYKLYSTDAGGNHFTSNQVAAVLRDEAEIVVCVGDSITEYNASAPITVPGTADSSQTYQLDGSTGSYVEDMLPHRASGARRRSAHVLNFGEFGRATTDWLLASGNAFVPAVPTTVATAMATFAANVRSGVKVKVVIMLGANDARTGVAASTYQSRILAIANYFLAQGTSWYVYLAYPTLQVPGSLTNQWTEAATDLIRQYGPALENVPALTTAPARCAVAARTPPGWSADNTSLLLDGVHPLPVGSVALAQMVSGGIDYADAYRAGGAGVAGGGTAIIKSGQRRRGR